MNTPINEAVEREAFQAAYGPKDSFAWRNDSGTYKVHALQMAWEIWLRRAALPPPIVEPVAYADPLAFVNFAAARVDGSKGAGHSREWMWANPDAGLVPLYTTPASAPSDGAADGLTRVPRGLVLSVAKACMETGRFSLFVAQLDGAIASGGCAP